MVVYWRPRLPWMLNVLQCNSEWLQCGHSIHESLQLRMRYYLVDVKFVEINVTHIAEMHNMCVSTCEEGSNFVELNFRIRVSWKFSRPVQRNIRQVTWLCDWTKIAVPLHSIFVKCNRVNDVENLSSYVTRRGKIHELRKLDSSELDSIYRKWRICPRGGIFDYVTRR